MGESDMNIMEENVPCHAYQFVFVQYTAPSYALFRLRSSSRKFLASLA